MTRSLSVNENAAEQDIVKRVSVRCRGLSPGSRVVVTIIAEIMLSAIARSRVVLGLEFQKCPLSLTLNFRTAASFLFLAKENTFRENR